ncbi:MAG: hydroxyacid dehydrogenase [Oscillospiraceae bacterium]|jgi:phosphoglycerate dehydrogenase-like enzyme|nr:hydroxyacid dehydrogenase [Oscillospiraceae bacterium]
MRAIFFGNHPRETFYSVYAQSVRKRIFGTAEPPVYNEESLQSADFRDVTALFSTWGMPSLREDDIQRYFPALQAVFYGAGSVQSFARPFLGCGVRVFSAWAANAVPVAEYTVAQIILANKGFFRLAQRYKQTGDRSRSELCGNYGAKIGLIGVGMIGSLVAEMLQRYQLEVLAFDPYLGAERASALRVQKTTLEEIFATCDVISNHLANNAQTQGMLHYALFAQMLPHAVFINTGRGAQVAEADLCRALTEAPGRTALLDVTDPEPPAADSPLFALPNVILTPHIAGSLANEVARMGDFMVQEYTAFTQGDPVQYEVTAAMLETMA